MRALFIGSVFSAIAAVLAPFLMLQLEIRMITDTHLSQLVIFLFFGIIAINGLLRKVAPKIALKTKELVIIFVMLLATITIAVEGLVGYLIGMISGHLYFATAENKWQELFFQYLPKWLFINDEKAVSWFFNGLPAGKEIPWKVWFKPLIMGWGPLIAGVLVMMYCAISLMQRQWSKRERLTFPLMEMPSQLVTVEKGKAFPELFRNKAFWIAVIVSTIIEFVYTQQGSEIIKPFICFLRQKYPFSLEPALPIYISFYLVIFPVVAFSYFVNLEILFSLWFFELAFIIMNGIESKMGFSLGEPGIYMGGTGELNAYLCGGAFLSVIMYGFWIARKHLKNAFLDALLFRKVEDDPDAILKYRLATWGLILSTAVVVIWMMATGMNFITAFIMIILSLIVLLGTAKIVSEGGLIVFRPCLLPQHMMTGIAGINAFHPAGLVALGLSYAWIADLKCIFPVAVAQGTRLKELFKVNRGIFGLSIVLAMIIGIVGAYSATLYLGYTNGAMTMNEKWILVGHNRDVYNKIFTKEISNKNKALKLEEEIANAEKAGTEDPIILSSLKENFAKTGFNQGKTVTMTIGAIIGILLVFLRQKFYWWPFHPIGFMAGDTWATRTILGSVLLTWVIKTLIVKYGGVRLYRKGKPLFLGLAFGACFGAALGVAVNYTFGWHL